jgi:hypothetical protein
MMEFGAQTSLSEDRRWELTQGIKRILWHLTAVCLKPVCEIPISSATTEDHAPQILGAILQANRVQQEIMDYNFKGDPVVAPLLTRFLLEIVAFHSRAFLPKNRRRVRRNSDRLGQSALLHNLRCILLVYLQTSRKRCSNNNSIGLVGSVINQ